MKRRYTTRDLDLLSQDLGAKLPEPETRKRRSQEESLMQRALLKWWHLQCRVFGVPELLLFSIPNGGGRSGPVVGSILKAEGLRKGAPDLMLAVPRAMSINQIIEQGHNLRDTAHALFLELKRPAGVVSPEQEVFHELLRAQGYRVEIIRSLTQGINQITSYLT